MTFPIILGIAVGLAMDALAVSIAGSIALKCVSGRQVFRFAFHFGLFQAMMPVFGWLAGRSVAGLIQAWDHWVAFALLLVIGGKAVIEALKGGDGLDAQRDPTRGVSLVMLSVATSIDALAVGLSFAMLGVSVWYPALVIGVVTAGLSAAGMLLGCRLGSRFGRSAGLIGGLVLVGIGVKILIEHLTAA